ncbi:MAG: PAS domain S-box protein [Pirellulales bacterium]|nr:PAS domain S-box protein [Pirellulales bacterium]
MASTHAPRCDSADLRRQINELADYLCGAVQGNFDLLAVVDTEDEDMQKLTMMVNFVLESARRAVCELQQREACLRSVLETAAEGILTANSDGIIQTCNRAAAAMFGYEPEEVLDRPIEMLMPDAVALTHRMQVERLLAQPATVSVPAREVTARHQSGRLFPISLAVSQAETRQGRMFTAIMRDLTEEKRMQCELAQAQRLESVGQLAAGIAHEINTPTQFIGDNLRFLHEGFQELQAIMAACGRLVEAIDKGAVQAEQLRDFAATWRGSEADYWRREFPSAIQQSLEGNERVASIVRAMKEFSHPGVDTPVLASLNDAVRTTVTVSRNEWKYVAEVELHLDPELPEIECLPGPLNQVILNLVINAAHAIEKVLPRASAEKGTIHISTSSGPDSVELRVSDSGCGIPPEIRDRVFDPFFTTKEVGKGTGQGLAIARNVVVDKHGGSISFESEVGRGTTFVVRLPLKQRQ